MYDHELINLEIKKKTLQSTSRSKEEKLANQEISISVKNLIFQHLHHTCLTISHI